MEGNIYVSLDEGKSWKPADGVPSGKASIFIEHPVDNRYVSIDNCGSYESIDVNV